MIILTIIQTVLTVLAVLLGLVLVLVLLVLFAPVRYRLWGDKSGEDINGRFAVDWLWFVIRAKGDYSKHDGDEGSFVWWLKLLFIRRLPKKEKAGDGAGEKETGGGEKNTKKKSGRKKASDNKRDPDTEKATGKGTEPDYGEDEQESDGAKKDPGSKREVNPALVTNKDSIEVFPGFCDAEMPDIDEDPDIDAIALDEEEKTSLFEKLSGFFEFVFSIPERVSQAVEDFTDAAFDKKQWLDKRLELLDNPRFEAAFDCVKEALIKLIVHILPVKGDVLVSFGMEDPAVTGQAVGMYSVVYPFVGKWLRIDPDFEDPHFDVKGQARGRIRIFTVLVIALKLWFNRDFQYIKKEYEKL